MKVQRSAGGVRINFENSFMGTTDLSGELPPTTKQNKVGHGFGMKSIKYILKKYGANMTVSGEDGVFKLNILFMR